MQKPARIWNPDEFFFGSLIHLHLVYYFTKEMVCKSEKREPLNPNAVNRTI